MPSTVNIERNGCKSKLLMPSSQVVAKLESMREKVGNRNEERGSEAAYLGA
jgi:hypothetical protein